MGLIKTITSSSRNTSIAIVVSLISLVIASHMIFFIFMNCFSTPVIQPLYDANTEQAKLIKYYSDKHLPDIEVYTSMYNVCANYKVHYMKITKLYYSNYFAISYCSIIFVSLLTIGAFAIANEGWTRASRNIKVFLATVSFISSVYYFLPNVLGSKDNINSNVNRYYAFECIQNNILDTLNQMPPENDTARLKYVPRSISNLYKQISANTRFFFTIDNSSVNNSYNEEKGLIFNSKH